MTNGFNQQTYSYVMEFRTLNAVTIRHVEIKSDGGHSLLNEEIVYIPTGEKLDIVAGAYSGLIGLHYKLPKNVGEDTTHSLGTSLEILENTTIEVYHASTVVEVSFPKEMEFYAFYSDGGKITTKEDYTFVNRSALPTKVNLQRYNVIESQISNIQPNVLLNRRLGTLGGYVLGGDTTGSFTIGGEYIGLFTVEPKKPSLQFIFSVEIDWDNLK